MRRSLVLATLMLLVSCSARHSVQNDAAPQQLAGAPGVSTPQAGSPGTIVCDVDGGLADGGSCPLLDAGLDGGFAGQGATGGIGPVGEGQGGAGEGGAGGSVDGSGGASPVGDSSGGAGAVPLCPDDQDTDGDGICDADDVCLQGDDRVDQDDDGTADACDGCPTDPAKTEPGVCGCDIPDDDSDDDDVLDCDDDCPLDPLKIEGGQCDCGVEDVQSDADGVADCRDGCPTDPLKLEDGECGCGVADVQSDTDGVADCNEECPTDPDKILRGLCGCGLSDLNSDTDPTPDCMDACPFDGNKITAGMCGCGNSELDTDEDDRADCVDLCPLIQQIDDTDTDRDQVPDACDRCPLDDPDDSDGDGVCDSDDVCPERSDADDDDNGFADACDELLFTGELVDGVSNVANTVYAAQLQMRLQCAGIATTTFTRELQPNVLDVFDLDASPSLVDCIAGGGLQSFSWQVSLLRNGTSFRIATMAGSVADLDESVISRLQLAARFDADLTNSGTLDLSVSSTWLIYGYVP